MGTFDDLVPKGGAAAGGSGAFSDLLPTDESKRVDRLRKISRAALGDAGAGDLYSDSFTWGLMKPVNALAGAAAGELQSLWGGGAEPEATFGERWKAGTQAYDEHLAAARENSGWLGTAADIAGSLTSGGPARGAVQVGVAPVVKQAATQGAVEGAARNSEDLSSAAKGAVTNAVTSAGTAAAVSQATKLLPGNRAARAAEREAARGPSGTEIKGQARNLYKQLDQAGIAYDNKQSVQLADDLISDLKQNGWDPGGIHKDLDKMIGDIEGQAGKPMSLETLANLRERVSAAAREGEPQVRRIAGRVLNQIDGFVDNQNPALSQLGQDVGPMWKEARRLWKTAGTVDDMNWRLDKAERRAASTNSGQNTENAIRQNVRQVQDRATQPGRYNPYTPEELAQMSTVVEGTTPQNLLRGAGNYLSGIPGQTAGLGAALGSITGGLTGHLDPAVSATLSAGIPAAAWGGGQLLKSGAANMAEDQADTLVRLIATGTKAPYANVPAGPPTREALAKILLQQQAARGAGNLAGQF